jgi:AcrR family transcriptional regulator
MSGLEIRRRPVQTRSAKTFDHILDTAIVVLEETGWDGFSTNLLAERAGIGVQTLYRYFPNKLSVVATLARRLISEWDSWIADTDIVSMGRSGIELFVARLKNQPGGVAIRQAMAASPSLRELDREDNRRLAERFAGDLVNLDEKVDYEDAVLSILVAIEAALAVVDLTYDLPAAQADRLTGLCVEMQSAFLANRFPILAKEIS